MSLPEALERAASALPDDGDVIRPANGDPDRLLSNLSPTAAVRLLHWLFEHEPAAADELAAAWCADPGGSSALGAIDAATLSKPGRKALRRTRHRLRSRGLEVPEPTVEPVVAKLPQLEERLEGAFVTPLDPRGTRLVYLVEPHPGGGVRVFELALDEERGVIECQVYTANRSQARRFMRDLGGDARRAAAPAPPEAVRALIARVATAQPSDRSVPRAFAEWRARLTDVPAGTPTPGALARQALSGAGEDAQTRDAVTLIREGVVGPWPPPLAQLERVAERVRESSGGRIIVSKLQQNERVEAVLRESVDELLDPARAECTAHRFDETAYVLWKSDRVDEARACLAAADELRQDGRAGSPVARALLERALAPVLEALERQEREREESSLLVKP
ncbi:MAG: hypothetical protein JSU66_03430 [Deltaproteobacteria bacterium]|nr:MAG: hypothetical protein JSU66_03430 [Deltaproteobacteria bacterium]